MANRLMREAICMRCDRIHDSPLFISYSWDKDGVLPLPFITGIRWRRLFHPVR
jgi:hypothetical protein